MSNYIRFTAAPSDSTVPRDYLVDLSTITGCQLVGEDSHPTLTLHFGGGKRTRFGGTDALVLHKALVKFAKPTVLKIPTASDALAATESDDA